MTSVGRIVRGGFAPFAEHPLAVLVWAIVYVATVVALAFAVRLGLPIEPPPGGASDPTAGMIALGSSLLLSLVHLAIYVVLVTAAMRSVLKPLQPGIAFLRLGADELRELALFLFFLILFYVGLLIAGIVLGVLTILFVGAAGTGPAMIAAIAVDAMFLLAVAAWFSVRFSLAAPLTLLRGTITISESWRLSRGRFWTLLGGFFLIYLVVLILSAGILAVTMGDYLAELARGGLTAQALQAARLHQMVRQLGPIDLHMLLGWLAAGIGGGLWVALQGGAFAAATRDLVDVQAEMAETFA